MSRWDDAAKRARFGSGTSHRQRVRARPPVPNIRALAGLSTGHRDHTGRAGREPARPNALPPARNGPLWCVDPAGEEAASGAGRSAACTRSVHRLRPRVSDDVAPGGIRALVVKVAAASPHLLRSAARSGRQPDRSRPARGHRSTPGRGGLPGRAFWPQPASDHRLDRRRGRPQLGHRSNRRTVENLLRLRQADNVFLALATVAPEAESTDPAL